MHDRTPFSAELEGVAAALHSMRPVTSAERMAALGFPEQQANGHDNAAVADPAMLGMLLWLDCDSATITDRLIRGLIGEQSLAVIAGPTGSGKTFLALDLAAHCAAGWEWFGRKVTRCGVLYVAAEAAGGLKKQIKAWKIGHPEAGAGLPFALYPAPIDLVTDPAGPAAIVAKVEVLKRLWAADCIEAWIIIVDTLARCFGGGDESATQDMSTFVSRCDTIRNQTGATILVVHHFGKDESKGMRGSIALKAASDTVVEVTGMDDVRTARIEKQKDGAAGDAFCFTLQSVDVGTDEDGGAVTSCIVVPSDQPAEKGKKRKPPPAEYLKAKDFLADVIAKDGQTVAISDIPPGVNVTLAEKWKERLEAVGLYDPGVNGRQWFHRVKTRLISDNIIAMNGKYVWLVSKRDARDAA